MGTRITAIQEQSPQAPLRAWIPSAGSSERPKPHLAMHPFSPEASLAVFAVALVPASCKVFWHLQGFTGTGPTDAQGPYPSPSVLGNLQSLCFYLGHTSPGNSKVAFELCYGSYGFR